MNSLNILSIPQNIWSKGPEDIYFFSLCIYKSVALVNELKRLKYYIVSSVHHYFLFPQDFDHKSYLNDRYKHCLIKVQNNIPHKYVAYSLQPFTKYLRQILSCSATHETICKYHVYKK